MKSSNRTERSLFVFSLAIVEAVTETGNYSMGTLDSPVARHKDSNSVTYLISHNNGCYWLRECVNTQLNPEDLCMHTYTYIYSYVLFTLYSGKLLLHSL